MFRAKYSLSICAVMLVFIMTYNISHGQTDTGPVRSSSLVTQAQKFVENVSVAEPYTRPGQDDMGGIKFPVSSLTSYGYATFGPETVNYDSLSPADKELIVQERAVKYAQSAAAHGDYLNILLGTNYLFRADDAAGAALGYARSGSYAFDSFYNPVLYIERHGSATQVVMVGTRYITPEWAADEHLNYGALPGRPYNDLYGTELITKTGNRFQEWTARLIGSDCNKGPLSNCPFRLAQPDGSAQPEAILVSKVSPDTSVPNGITALKMGIGISKEMSVGFFHFQRGIRKHPILAIDQYNSFNPAPVNYDSNQLTRLPVFRLT